MQLNTVDGGEKQTYMGRVSECLSATAHDRIPSSPSPHAAAHKSGTDPESAGSAETFYYVNSMI